MFTLDPWWIWLVPVIRVFITGAFIVVAGLVQGKTTGRYPTLAESCEAFRTLLFGNPWKPLPGPKDDQQPGEDDNAGE